MECVKELDFDTQDVCMITSTKMSGVGIPTVPHALLTEFDDINSEKFGLMYEETIRKEIFFSK